MREQVKSNIDKITNSEIKCRVTENLGKITGKVCKKWQCEPQPQTTSFASLSLSTAKKTRTKIIFDLLIAQLTMN